MKQLSVTCDCGHQVRFTQTFLNVGVDRRTCPHCKEKDVVVWITLDEWEHFGREAPFHASVVQKGYRAIFGREALVEVLGELECNCDVPGQVQCDLHGPRE